MTQTVGPVTITGCIEVPQNYGSAAIHCTPSGGNPHVTAPSNIKITSTTIGAKYIISLVNSHMNLLVDIEIEANIKNGFLVFSNVNWPFGVAIPPWQKKPCSHPFDFSVSRTNAAVGGSEVIVCDRMRYRLHGFPSWSSWRSLGSSVTVSVN